MTGQLSPEFRLVALCGLASDEVLGRRASVIVGRSFDWNRAESLARRHGIFAMTGARLASIAPDLMPDEMAVRSRDELTGNLALQTAQLHQTAGLVSQLEEQSVRAVVLKGAPLAMMLYPDRPEWRYSADIDLLIDPSDLAVADEVLERNKLERTWPDEATVRAVPQSVLSRFAKDYQYIAQDGSTYVELHHRLTLNPHVLDLSFDKLHDESVRVDTGFGAVRALDGPILPAYLAWHAIAEINHGLKWFADVSRARRRLGAAKPGTQAPAVALGVPQRALDLVAQIELLLVGEGRAEVSQLAHGICRRMDTSERAGPRRTLARFPKEAAYVALQFRMAEGSAARRYVLWRSLTDPRDARVLGGRRWPAFVYAIAGPFLALARYAGRLFGNR